MVDKLKYIAIPDTSDTDYWELKTSNTKERYKTFVPKDKELHRQLQLKLREASTKRMSRQKQLEYHSRVITNKRTWIPR